LRVEGKFILFVATTGNLGKLTDCPVESFLYGF